MEANEKKGENGEDNVRRLKRSNKKKNRHRKKKGK